MTKFEHLEEFPYILKGRMNSFIATSFDDSMTVEMQLRVLIDWIKKNIDLTNEMVDYLNKFIETYDTNLYATLDTVLTKWKNDGKLTDLFKGSLLYVNGTYPSITELNNAFPTGANGLYIVTDTNSWYYWAEGKWQQGGVFADSKPLATIQNYNNFIKNGWLENDDLSNFFPSNNTKITPSTFLSKKWLNVTGTNSIDSQGIRIGLDNSISDYGYNRWYNFSCIFQNDVFTKFNLYVKYLYEDGNYDYNNLIDSFSVPKNTAFYYKTKVFLPEPITTKKLTRIELLFLQADKQLVAFNIGEMNLNVILPTQLNSNTVDLFSSVINKYQTSSYQQVFTKGKTGISVTGNEAKYGLFLQKYVSGVPTNTLFNTSVELFSTKPLTMSVYVNGWKDGVKTSTQWSETVSLKENQINKIDFPVNWSGGSDVDNIEFGIIAEENTVPFTVFDFQSNVIYPTFRSGKLISKDDLYNVSFNVKGNDAVLQTYQWEGVPTVKYLSTDKTTQNQGIRWFFDMKNVRKTKLALKFALANQSINNSISVLVQLYGENGNDLYTKTLKTINGPIAEEFIYNETVSLTDTTVTDLSDVYYGAIIFTSTATENPIFTVSRVELEHIPNVKTNENLVETSKAVDYDNFIQNGSMILSNFSQYEPNASTLNYSNFMSKKWLLVITNGGRFNGLFINFDMSDLDFGTVKEYNFSMWFQSDVECNYVVSVKGFKNNVLTFTKDLNTFTALAGTPIRLSQDFVLPDGDYDRFRIEILTIEEKQVAFNVTLLSLMRKKRYDRVNNVLYSGEVRITQQPMYEENFTSVVGSLSDWEGARISLDKEKFSEVISKTMVLKTKMFSNTDNTILFYLKVFDKQGVPTINQQFASQVFVDRTIRELELPFTVPNFDYNNTGAIELLITNRTTAVTNFAFSPITFEMETRKTVTTNTNTNTFSSSTLPVLNLDINVGELADGKKHKTILTWIDGDGNLVEEYVEASYQGDSSALDFALKKSFRLRAYTDSTYETKKKLQWITGFKPTSDINLKAYWVDWTVSNNKIISHNIRKLTLICKDGLESEQVYADTQEQVIGQPLSLFMRNNYYGLFEASLKKTDALNLDDKKPTNVAIQGSKYTPATRFEADTAEFNADIDFSVEVPDTLTPEMKASFESLMKLTNSGTDEEFKTTILSKINIASVANLFVAYMIFSVDDVWGKNTIWETRDGIKWNVVAYDHDLAYGNDWQGLGYNKDMTSSNLSSMINRHKLLIRLFETGLIQDEVYNRYKLFTNQVTLFDVLTDFEKRWEEIGFDNYNKNHQRWLTQPFTNVNNFSDIKRNIMNRWKYVESVMTLDNLNSFKK